MHLTKAEIRLARLLAKRKFRDNYSLFVVEGEKLVKEARESGWEIYKEYHTNIVGQEAMSRMTLLSSPSPALALVRIPQRDIFEMPDSKSLYLALDSVKDPGNLGTIIRLSEWFGIKAIYCSADCVDVYNPKVVQATMGALFRVRVYYTNIAELLYKVKEYKSVYGTFLEGENIYEITPDNNAIIVLGSESDGISQKLSSLIKKRVTIPSFTNNSHSGESLNVAIAAAVVCSEFRRSSALQSQKAQ